MLNTRYKMYGSNSTDNNNSFENSSKLYNGHFKTKNQTINEKVGYTERKYADKKQLVFPIFESPRPMQKNTLHRLTRRKRSGFGVGSGNLNKCNNLSTRLKNKKLYFIDYIRLSLN